MILFEAVERARSKSDSLLIHDDGNDVMSAASRCSLDVVRLHC